MGSRKLKLCFLIISCITVGCIPQESRERVELFIQWTYAPPRWCVCLSACVHADGF